MRLNLQHYEDSVHESKLGYSSCVVHVFMYFIVRRRRKRLVYFLSDKFICLVLFS